MKNDFISNEQKRETDLQEFMAAVIKSHKHRNFLVYILAALVIVFGTFNTYMIFKLRKEMQTEYIKILKKIDHRYFNITRSLEYIHDVKIDTLDGHLLFVK